MNISINVAYLISAGYCKKKCDAGYYAINHKIDIIYQLVFSYFSLLHKILNAC